MPWHSPEGTGTRVSEAREDWAPSGRIMGRSVWILWKERVRKKERNSKVKMSQWCCFTGKLTLL